MKTKTATAKAKTPKIAAKAAPKAKVTAKPKNGAAKPTKAAAKITKTKEPVMTTETVNPIDALFAEYIGADQRGDDFIKALLQKAFDAGKAAPRARAPRAGGPTKREIAADLLRRKEGCTSKDILDATQWPAVSVPAIAKASGLKLTQTKEGRVTTYFGTPA